MPRSTAAIQAEITNIEGQLASLAAVSSWTAGGKSKTNQQYGVLANRLDLLYQQLDRATGAAPMTTRGRVTGLGSNIGAAT